MKLTKGEIKFLRELMEVIIDDFKQTERFGNKLFKGDKIMVNKLLKKLL